MLKEKISLLSDNHRDALAADIDAIMYTTEGDIRIYYNDDGTFRILKHLSNGQSFSWFCSQQAFSTGVFLNPSHSVFFCL